MGSADDMRQAGIRAQAVLDMLYGALQMAWKDPKVLQEAVAGLVATLEDTPTEMEQAFGLVQYLEAVLTPLQRLSSKKAFMVAQCRKKKRRRSNSKSPLVPRGNDDVDEHDDESSVKAMEWEAPEDDTLTVVTASPHRRLEETVEEEGEEEGEEEEEYREHTVEQAGAAEKDSVGMDEGKELPSQHMTRCERVMVEVLSCDDLLSNVFTFLAAGEATARHSIRRLGTAALVCRRWRKVALRKELWGPIARTIIPSMPSGVSYGYWSSEEEGDPEEAVADRHRVLSYGRMLVTQKKLWCGNDWRRGLELMLEVVDRKDGMTMLVARGILTIRIDTHTIDLRIAAGPRLEVGGPAFSAVSKDPERRRYASISEYLTGRPGDAAGGAINLMALDQPRLIVRATVRELRTGRRALLWDECSSSSIVRTVQEPSVRWRQRLPEGSLAVSTPASQRQLLTCPSYHGPSLKGSSYFFCSPLEGQAEDVAPEERRYRLAVMGEDRMEAHSAPCGVTLATGDEALVARYVRSVLQD